MTGLFLDPPYRHALKGGEKNRDSGLYGSDGAHSDRLVDEVIAYCLERGDSPQMRIAACGYEGEGYEALVEKGWECVAWSSQGGYANRNKKNRNRDRERLYFSPHTVKPDLGLFAGF
jgi:DNA adenine methylase